MSAVSDGRERARGKVEATRIPSHGNGRLAPMFGPGNPGGPGQKPLSLRDIRKLARAESLDAVHALIAVYKTPNGKISRNADPKVVVAAASAIIKIGYGEMPAYDPTQERPEVTYDLSGLTLEQRRMLLNAMDKGAVVAAAAEDESVPAFDPSRFEELPTLEAIAMDPSLDPTPPPPTLAPPPKKPRRKPGPKKVKGRRPGSKPVPKGAEAAKAAEKAVSRRAKRAQALRVDASATVEGPELPPTRSRLNLF